MALSIQAATDKILAAMKVLTDSVNAVNASVAQSNIALGESNALLALIAKALGVGTPQKMQLQFKGEKIGMPGQETDTQTIPCSALETDGAGQPVVLNPANVQWAIDDATIATLTQNSDGSATFKALKPGTANVSCTDTVANVTGTDTLTVVAGPAKTLVLQFGTATP